MKKLILIFLVISIIAGISYGLWKYFEPTADISNQKAEISIESNELIQAFEKNATEANTNYTGKVIAVKGKVANMENPQSMTFEGGEKYIISFQFNDSLNVTYNPGTTLTVKGQYNGFIEPDDMFGMPGNIQISQSKIEN